MFENGLEMIRDVSHCDKVVWNDIVYQWGFACKKTRTNGFDAWFSYQKMS